MSASLSPGSHRDLGRAFPRDPRRCRQQHVDTFDPTPYLRVGGDSERGPVGEHARSGISKKRVRWIERTPSAEQASGATGTARVTPIGQGRSLTRVRDRWRVVVARSGRPIPVHEQGVRSARRRQDRERAPRVWSARGVDIWTIRPQLSDPLQGLDRGLGAARSTSSSSLA